MNINFSNTEDEVTKMKAEVTVILWSERAESVHESLQLFIDAQYIMAFQR